MIQYLLGPALRSQPVLHPLAQQAADEGLAGLADLGVGGWVDGWMCVDQTLKYADSKERCMRIKEGTSKQGGAGSMHTPYLAPTKPGQNI